MKQYDVVLGALYGDEGKGKTVEYICKTKRMVNSIVVRFGGGHQVGHTCIKNGVYHGFHHFGSGTLLGVPTYWDKNCTILPPLFVKELKQLKEMEVIPTIYFHRNCPITTDFDIEVNRLSQAETLHGTTGLGFGQTLKRESEFFHFHLEDLFFGKDILEQKLIMVYHEYYGLAIEDNLYKIVQEDIKKIYEPFVALFSKGHAVMVDDETMLQQYDNIVFEGSQGLLLDQHTGFFPHVTRSNVSEKNVMRFLNSDDTLTIHYVLRSYLTKHGDGFLLNEGAPNTISIGASEHNKHNENQGEFRKTYLSLPYLRYALVKNMSSVRNGIAKSLNFYINCLDHLKDFCLYNDDNKLLEFKTEKEFLDFLARYIRSIYTGYSVSINFYVSSTPYSEYDLL